MTNKNEQMIIEIRERLNLVNQSVIDTAKFEDADEKEIQEIHSYVTTKS